MGSNSLYCQIILEGDTLGKLWPVFDIATHSGLIKFFGQANEKLVSDSASTMRQSQSLHVCHASAGKKLVE